MPARTATLTSLACILPVLAWLAGQIAAADAAQVPALVRSALTGLWWLLLLAATVGAPLLGSATVRDRGLGPVLLVLTPAPLYLLAWLTGAADGMTLIRTPAGLLGVASGAALLGTLPWRLRRWPELRWPLAVLVAAMPALLSWHYQATWSRWLGS